MTKLLRELRRIKSLKNNYLSLKFLAALTLISLGSYAQYDSTKSRTLIPGYGNDWKNTRSIYSHIIPNDTPKLALRDSNALALKGGYLWMYNGVHWLQMNSGTIITNDPGVDSLSWHPPILCSWLDGTSTCYNFDVFIVDIVNNWDSTGLNYVNFVGDSLGTVDLNHKLFFQRTGIIGKDTSAVYHGKTRDGTVIYLDYNAITPNTVVEGDITWQIVDSLNTPAGSPIDGEFYLVGDVPTGAFVGHAKDIAEWNSPSYIFHDADTGNIVYNIATDIKSEFNGVTWVWKGNIPFIVGGNSKPNALQRFGNKNNQGLSIITNNAIRATWGGSGSLTLIPQAGTGTRLLTATSTGLVGNIAVPNSIKKYLTGYNTYGSFNDTARAAISLTTTGSSGSATYNSATGVFNIPNYALGGDLQAVTTAGNITTTSIQSGVQFAVKNGGGQSTINIQDTLLGVGTTSFGFTKNNYSGYDDRGSLYWFDNGARSVHLTVDSISPASPSKLLLPVGSGRLIKTVDGNTPDIFGNVLSSGGGGGNGIYGGSGSLSGGTDVTMNGNALSFSGTSGVWIFNDVPGQLYASASDGIGHWSSEHVAVSGFNNHWEEAIDNGTNFMHLNADADANTFLISAGTSGKILLKNSATSGATNGDLLTVVDHTTGEVGYAHPGGGSGVTSIATTSPITGGTITSTGTIGINNAAADGSTKGAASFTANDFDASSGNISIDYTNGQAASGSNKGFLTSADWTTFNGKGAGTVTSFGKTDGLGITSSVANATSTPNHTIAVDTSSVSILSRQRAAATYAPITGGAYLPLAGGTMTGNLLFTDNTYDIGATGATRPRTGYFGTSLISPLYNGLAITNNGTNTLSISAGKTLTATQSLTLSGTDATVMTFPTTSATIARTDAAQTFTGSQTYSGNILATGSLFSTTTNTNSNFWIVGGTVPTSSFSATGLNIGANPIQLRAAMRGSTATVLTAGTDYFAMVFGDNKATEGTSGVHAKVGGVAILTQTLTNGTATTTDFQNLYVDDAPASVATNNWALNTGSTLIRGKLSVSTGSNASVGTATLVAGTVTVSTTAAATASKIFCTVVTPGGTQGFISVPTIVNGTSFTINSTSASETSTVNWWIIN